MRRSKFTESQIVEILQSVEGGLPMSGIVTVAHTRCCAATTAAFRPTRGLPNNRLQRTVRCAPRL